LAIVAAKAPPTSGYKASSVGWVELAKPNRERVALRPAIVGLRRRLLNPTYDEHQIWLYSGRTADFQVLAPFRWALGVAFEAGLLVEGL